MVRFHMVDNKILDGTFADYALYLPKIYLKVTNIYSINQRNRFIVYQVRVVRHSVRQWPHTFKQMLIAVIHSHVVDFSFYHCFWVHCYYLLI